MRRYKKIRLLGKGGMSEVYEAEDVRLGSRHALKLFTGEGAGPELRERFQNEGKLLARLSHPRIVRVTDVGTAEEDGAPFLVMDLVVDAKGAVCTLADVTPGSVDEETVGRWYDDIREALAYIHARGVVHRDLKLQNILIGVDGHAVLADFGISKVGAAGDGGKVVDVVDTLTRVRDGKALVMGSVGYMAPELEMGVAASPQSDWYALGVIVYRLLTGTWCDSRTDIIGTLETYDPVWSRIVPKLLHAHPEGRACLSYAEEKRRDRERAEVENEARLDEARIRRWKDCRLTWGLVALCGVLLSLLVLAVGMDLGRADGPVPAERTRYGFDEIFRIPSEVKADSKLDEEGNVVVPAREDVERTRIDMLVLTYAMLTRLQAGQASVSDVIAELERMQDEFDLSTATPFDRWPSGYFPVGDDETACWMLGRAVERMQELADE